MKPIGYCGSHEEADHHRDPVRAQARGWTQSELAVAAATWQATVSAYERREKPPPLAVTERLVGAAGYSLKLDVTVDFSPVTFDGQAIYQIPNRLWRVEPRLSARRDGRRALQSGRVRR
jgi:transcriptional regulator with XRE-family HTH domain